MAVYLGIDTYGLLFSSEGHALKSSDDFLLTALAVSTKLKIILNNEVCRLNLNLNLKEAE